jgi:hypothetical protein
MNQFENIQKFGKENVEATMKAFSSLSTGAQTIAVETADYAKKSFEHSTSMIEKLVGAKSLDKAIEIQADYMKASYEGFVAQATKMGELYANLAKESLKPIEGLVTKAGVAR